MAMPNTAKNTKSGISFTSTRVCLRRIACPAKQTQAIRARQKAISMGSSPWEKARLANMPMNPQQNAAERMKKYPAII